MMSAAAACRQSGIDEAPAGTKGACRWVFTDFRSSPQKNVVDVLLDHGDLGTGDAYKTRRTGQFRQDEELTGQRASEG
jgi:hypothetical protein